MSEEWRDIKNYEGLYQVSNTGKVRSLDRKVPMKRFGGTNRNIKGVMLKHGVTYEGYRVVSLCKNNISFSARIHKLVADHFLNNPKNKNQVNHINGIKTDNRLENLEFCTHSENQRHAVRLGLRPLGEAVKNSKLTKEKVLYIKSMKGKCRTKDLADKYKVSTSLILLIWRGKRWKHLNEMEKIPKDLRESRGI